MSDTVHYIILFILIIGQLFCLIMVGVYNRKSRTAQKEIEANLREQIRVKDLLIKLYKE